MNFITSKQRSDVHHRPLRTAVELAEEFGLSCSRALGAAIANSPVSAPKPTFKHRSDVSNTWYDPVLMRRWWKAHNQALAMREAA